jgi:hypothetical protein
VPSRRLTRRSRWWLRKRPRPCRPSRQADHRRRGLVRPERLKVLRALRCLLIGWTMLSGRRVRRRRSAIDRRLGPRRRERRLVRPGRDSGLCRGRLIPASRGCRAQAAGRQRRGRRRDDREAWPVRLFRRCAAGHPVTRRRRVGPDCPPAPWAKARAGPKLCLAAQARAANPVHRLPPLQNSVGERLAGAKTKRARSRQPSPDGRRRYLAGRPCREYSDHIRSRQARGAESKDRST